MKGKSMKTILALTLGVMLLSSMGLAAWKLSLNGDSITGLVTSQKGGVMMVDKQFDTFSLMDTTNHSETFETYARIKNNNGDLNFTLNITEVRDDIDDECTEYESDISTQYLFNGVEVQNGDNVMLNSGYNYLNMTAVAVMQSCPQNLTVNWALV